MLGKPRFMISYSHTDRDAVDELVKKIEDAGIEYFLDKKIGYGEDIPARVFQGISACTHLLVYISPASLKSQWVLLEVGMGLGMHRKVVPILSHPSLDLPGPLVHIKHVKNAAELDGLLAESNQTAVFDYSYKNPVERRCAERLFHSRESYASAIRLFGGDGDLIPEQRCVFRYSSTAFIPPAELQAASRAWLSAKEAEARRTGQVFFNGPAARLISWRASPNDGPGAAREMKSLEMELGPVDWYDFEGNNGAFRNHLPKIGLESFYEEYVGLSQLLSDGDVRGSRLSNFLDTATTILTSDGLAAFQRRSNRVASVPGRITSAVAEGVNRYLDDLDAQGRRVNSPATEAGREADNSYEPEGVVSPFAAAIRGIVEELSPDLEIYCQAPALKLSGLSFDLEALHPDALFVLTLPLSSRQLLDVCKQNPGSDFFEGSLDFVPAILGNKSTEAVLRDEQWIPAGKASLIRALQAAEAISQRFNVSAASSLEIIRELD